MTAPAEPRSGGEEEDQGECRECGTFIDYEDREPTGICWPCEVEELRAEIARLRSPAWTSEAPKVPGWYWALATNGDRCILQVAIHSEAGPVVVVARDDLRPVAQNLTIRWAGPILPPATPDGAS
jgi:hypothetical protein